MNKITIIVGAAYGSEAKGTIAGYLAVKDNYDIAVRTGAINAGHSVYYKDKKYAMQQIPVAWINYKTKLVIGPGAYIHVPTLEKEINMINEAMPGQDVRDRLFIDFRAGLHTDGHHREEQASKLHERMGSTGEGVAAAIVDKMKRQTGYKFFRQTPEAELTHVEDTVQLLTKAYHAGERIMVEGTQGTMLDFHLGAHPFVTSRQTIASAWIAEAGLPPNFGYEVVLVARTFPIRVAGNSGPLSQEISWRELAEGVNAKRVEAGMPELVSSAALSDFKEAEEAVAKQMGLPTFEIHTLSPTQRAEFATELSNFHSKVFEHLPPPTIADLRRLLEITTVTKKLRRIAKLDVVDLRFACLVNNPAYVSLMFLNYVFPTTERYSTAAELKASPEWPLVDAYLQSLTKIIGVPIRYVNTNPTSVIDLQQLP